MKAFAKYCLLSFFLLFLFSLVIPPPLTASEWIISDDVIGAPPGPGFDQNNNLYYSGLFSALRIRTSSGSLIKQVGLSSTPFSSTGFSTFDVRDMAVAPDGTVYFLIADNLGYSATAIKVVGLQADHQTAVSWQLTYNDLASEYPAQIAVDSDNNLVVMTCGYYLYNGNRTTFIDSVVLAKYDSAGQQVWTRPVEFPILFPNLKPHSYSFFPQMFTDPAGAMIYVANEGDFSFDQAGQTVTSPTNILLIGINGSDGSIRFSKQIGDMINVFNGVGHRLTVLSGNFGGRPYNGTVDPNGRLLLIGYDELLGSGYQTQSGSYWLLIDKDGIRAWERYAGDSLPASLAGPDPDLVGSVAFDYQGFLYLLGRQNASALANNSSLPATGAYVAHFNLSGGDPEVSRQ